jgi:hypothetical protein
MNEGVFTTMATAEELQAELEKLRAENEALKKRAERTVFLKVSDKGGVSLYGLGRFPVTLYVEQWEKVLDMASEIRTFLETNRSSLKRKDQRAD